MWISFVLTFTACVALSLSIKRHFLQVYPRRLAPRWLQALALPAIAYLSLTGALIAAVQSQGLTLGLVTWLGLMTLTAMLQSLLLGYRPQWVLPLNGAVLVMSALSRMIVNGLK